MGNSYPTLQSEQAKAQVLNHQCSLAAIAEYIRSGRARRIVLMVGAGISVSAGIPDFRSPGSGLYHNLQKYHLPTPEKMFCIEYFRSDPTPFFDLAKHLMPSNFKPTPMHYFMRLLEAKGLLRRVYTQNIDTLERQAGVSPELIIEAHGSFGSAHCVNCNRPYSFEYFRDKIETKSDGMRDEAGELIPWCKCDECGGNVKPDIVFFGEGLPRRYFENLEPDLSEADLLIVAGTSLQVVPFSETMHYCHPAAPRLLINKVTVGKQRYGSSEGFKFDRFDNYRDVKLLSTVDDGVRMLCDLVGWRRELEDLIAQETGAAPNYEPIQMPAEVVHGNQRRSYPAQCFGTKIISSHLNATVGPDQLLVIPRNELLELLDTDILQSEEPTCLLSNLRASTFTEIEDGSEDESQSVQYISVSFLLHLVVDEVPSHFTLRVMNEGVISSESLDPYFDYLPKITALPTLLGREADVAKSVFSARVSLKIPFDGEHVDSNGRKTISRMEVWIGLGQDMNHIKYRFLVDEISVPLA